MKDIWSSELLKENSFDIIFFIASFHHLETFDDRKKVLDWAKKLLKVGWYICMTNWALESPLNKEKYKTLLISWSENEFWSKDFNIKIWEHGRFYHSFTLKELDFLFKEVWFSVVENRLFDTEKNFISIIKK